MAEQMRKYASVLPGELQDLTKEIALISPTDTPLTTLLYSMGKTVGATDITVSWRERDLHKPSSVLENLMLEGAEAPDSIHSTRKMVSNICQIMSKATSISGTLNALNPYGIGNEYANEIADRLLELKRDMEYFFISGTKAVENDSTPRQMNGLMNLVGHSIDLTSSELTEDVLIDAMEKMWECGVSSENIYAFCGATIKRKINKLLADNSSTRIAAQLGQRHPLGIMVDKLVSDFGDFNLVLNRHMPKDAILIVDLNEVEIATLRPVFFQELAKTGDYTKGQIITENTIKLLNSKA
ncbi:MAG: DUF5309 domain-containing protein, partial [Peptostreptococcaceae bacterium]|nr:DUF5309 domain-containing protein [Peptostreptococcaceae bacterium]